MPDHKIYALLALSLILAPVAGRAELSKTVSPAALSEAIALAASKLQPMGSYVGELQEKWQFPSDHIPIGMTFDNLHFLSWNVLDAQYMSWVLEKNSQGLSRSLIVDEHVYTDNSKLTIRDKHVADLVLEAISHPTHPRALLALQECSNAFIEELRSRIPAHFEILSSQGESLLFDRRLFEVVWTKEVPAIFANEPQRKVQDITLCRLDNGQWLRLVNVHLPGDPTKPARFEFAEYLAKTFDPDLTTIAMGDMNFNELEMSNAMKLAFQGSSPFSLYSPYCTNISPYVFNSKAIDHFLVHSPEGASVVLSHPNEILSGLEEVVALLQNPEIVEALFRERS